MENGFKLKWKEVNAWAVGKNTSSWFRTCSTKSLTQVLENVSGTAFPGRMLAIVGPIGCGKTALLNYLADDHSLYLKYSGAIEVNDKKVMIGPNSQYIKQSDNFHRLVTVEEHIVFHAKMHYGKKYKSKNIKEKIENIISAFNLASVKECVIYEVDQAKKSLSSGHRRLLTIATALVKNPKILFADCPFAGLDNDSALITATYLKNFASRGRTVICSLNYPTKTVFNYFDDLLMMLEGHSVFIGPINNLELIFTRLGYKINEEEKNDCSAYLTVMCQMKYEQSKEPYNIMNAISSCVPDEQIKDLNVFSNKAPNNPSSFSYFFAHYGADPFTQFGLLFQRSIRVFYRNPIIPITRILQDLILSLLLGLLYLKIPLILPNIITVAGIFFFELSGIILNGTVGVLPTFTNDYKIQRSESKLHLYRSTAYYFAKTLCELPIQLVTNTLFAVIMFYMVDMRNGVIYFLWHWLLVLLMYQCSYSYGYMISAISGDPLITAALLTPFLLPLIILGGFLLPNNKLPIYLTWIDKISWFQYGFNNVEIINFRDRVVPFNNPDATSGINGNLLLNIIGINSSDFKPNIGILIGLIIGYKFLGALFLIIRTFIGTKFRT